MSESQNWRPETNAFDYLAHQKKQLSVADRRPVPRRASDLVGPGIAGTAVRLDDFNDLLATYNGFYSAAPGSMNSPVPTEAFVGHITSDAELGGVQTFTSLTTESVWQRVFRRNPNDADTLYWGAWRIIAV